MLKTTLYDFQREDVQRINEFDGRALVANEVGLGKSLTALYYAWRYLPDDPPGPIVVTCPSHLKIHWSREARKHLGIRVEILNGQRCPAEKPPPHDPNQVYVVNYDVLTPPHWKVGARPPADSWLHYLCQLRPRLVIADEGQYLRNYSSARTRAMRVFAKACPRVIVLTGTPLANKPADLWPICAIVNRHVFPSRMDFLHDYTNLVRRPWGWDPKGARNLDDLHARLKASMMIRRRKVDVLDQLPRVTYTTIPVEVDYEEYRKAEADYIGWLYDKSPALAASAARAEELARLNGLKKLAGELKAPSVVAWARDLLEETEGKLLVGAHHHAVTKTLIDGFGRRAVLVDGTMGHEDKQSAFDRFNKNAKCDVMIANLQAGGTGWSCTSTSDVAICELPWVPSDVEQFCGRVVGIGRGKAGQGAHVRFLVAEGTIDCDLAEVLERKRAWAALAIDGTTPADEWDVVSEVKRAIAARHGRGDSR